MNLVLYKIKAMYVKHNIEARSHKHCCRFSQFWDCAYWSQLQQQ